MKDMNIPAAPQERLLDKDVGTIGWVIVVIVAMSFVMAAYFLSQVNQASLSVIEREALENRLGVTGTEVGVEAQEVGPELSSSTDLGAIEDDLNASQLEDLDRELDEILNELDF